MNEKLTAVVEPIEHMLERLSVNTVFGEPTKEGDVTVIPVAEIGVGFGYGFGRGTSGAAEGEQQTADIGEGGGGGAGGRARPIGYVRISSDGVRFEPILDETRIALAGIAMGAWSVFWIGKTIRALANVFAKKGQGAHKRNLTK